MLSAEPACSLATLRGTYGFAVSGNAVIDRVVYFFAAAGRLKADGSGKMTVKDTASTQGLIQRRSYGGTYTMGEDCTGAIVLILDGIATNFDIVVSPDGKEIQFLQTDPGVVSSGTARLHSLPDRAPQ